jgi:hypothetical protein
VYEEQYQITVNPSKATLPAELELYRQQQRQGSRRRILCGAARGAAGAAAGGANGSGIGLYFDRAG